MYQAMYNFPIGSFVTFDDIEKSIYVIERWEYSSLKIHEQNVRDVTVVLRKIGPINEIYYAHPLTRVREVESN